MLVGFVVGILIDTTAVIRTTTGIYSVLTDNTLALLLELLEGGMASVEVTCVTDYTVACYN